MRRPILRAAIALLLIVFMLLAGLTDACAQRQNDPNESTPYDSSMVASGYYISLINNERMVGATVKIYTYHGLQSNDLKLESTSKTDENGRIFVENLPTPYGNRFSRLKYALVLDAEGHTPSLHTFHALNANRLRIGTRAATGKAKGKVVDEHGQPVVGAIVSAHWNPIAVRLGMRQFTTKENGLFLISRIAAGKVSLTVSHPDYPRQSFTRVADKYSELKLIPGATITGQIVNDQTGSPLKGVMVSALPWRSYREIRDTYATTDDQGRFRMNVLEGSYKIMLEDDDWVMEAKQVDGRKGQNVDLGILSAGEGGWIVGQITHSQTGQPMIYSTREGEEKIRVTLGLYGPSRPRGKLIHQEQLAEVDASGQFKLRAFPGENYPYVYNLGHTTRTAFNTMKQPPVIVRAGQETRIELTHTPKRTVEQKMADAKRVLDSLPAGTDARVKAIIEEFRKLNHTIDESELWCSLMRELTVIGKPAVPQLCDELDSFDRQTAIAQQNIIRRIAFALRAIGDPRAVPALIRAFPKTLQPPLNDYGCIVDDLELTQFMLKHQIEPKQRGTHFGFGRPVREVHAALHRLTKHGTVTTPVSLLVRREDPRARSFQEKAYHRVAKQWADYWESHWKEFDVPQEYSVVELPDYTPPDLTDYPTGLTLTAKARIDYSASGNLISPIGDPDRRADFFFDLDVGRWPSWPKDVPREDTSEATVSDARNWAAQRGADLTCMMNREPNGRVTYTLAGIDMRLWEIDKFDAKKLKTFLAKSKLPPGRKLVDDLLLHYDEASGAWLPQKNSSFLYLTREQGIGVITITDFVTKKTNEIGNPFGPDPGTGAHRGVRFTIQTIAR